MGISKLMCNRFFQEHQSQKVADKYAARNMMVVGEEVKDVYPSYRAAVVANEQGERVVQQMYWAFIPSWVKDDDLKKFSKPNNARDDTIIKSLSQRKGMFYAAMKSARCVLPSSGWVEYSGEKGSKVANRLTVKGQEIISIAGLYTYRKDFPGLSCTMITTAAEGRAAELHDRIPVVLLTDEAVAEWLDPESDPLELAMKYFKCVPDDLLVVEQRPEDQKTFKKRPEGGEDLFNI